MLRLYCQFSCYKVPECFQGSKPLKSAMTAPQVLYALSQWPLGATERPFPYLQEKRRRSILPDTKCICILCLLHLNIAPSIKTSPGATRERVTVETQA